MTYAINQKHIYCIFCETQKTSTIAQLIEEVLRIRCISPRIVQRYWKQGREEHHVHDYLPGYIFLYTEEPVESFRDVCQFPGVLRVLGREENDYELEGADRSFAAMLHEMGGTIGIMKAYREGDHVKLANHLYQGFTGEIVRMDRRKGRAQIRFDFDGSTQYVWVGYDLIHREPQASPVDL